MKGLLIKDLHIVWKQTKVMLLVILGYTCIGSISDGNTFWASFSVIFMSMIPITVMGMDERSKWEKYAVMLPYSKKEMVLSKYILGIGGSAVVIILYSILKIIAMTVKGISFQPMVFVGEMLPIMLAPCFFLGINLPIMFKMGTEKGRMWFILSMVVLMIGASLIMSYLNEAPIDSIVGNINNISITGTIGVIVTAISIIFLIASMILSIRLYEKKEI